MGKRPLNENQIKTLRKLVDEKPLQSLLLNLGVDLMLRSSDLLKLNVSDVMNESGTPKTNLIKLKPTEVSPSVNSKNANDIPKKKAKYVKPPKVLKYGNKKSSISIKKEDEE